MVFLNQVDAHFDVAAKECYIDSFWNVQFNRSLAEDYYICCVFFYCVKLKLVLFSK